MFVAKGYAQLTWHYQNPLPQGNSLRDVQFLNPMTAVAVGEVGTIIRTEDGGNSWTPQTSGTSNTLLAVSIIDADIATAVGRSGTILRTIDGGSTWAPQGSSISSIDDVVFLDADTGYVAGFGFILKTTDGGETWTSLNAQSTFIDGLSFIDPKNGIVVGARGETSRTNDGGDSWTNLWKEVAGNELVGIHFPSESIGFAVGANGTIVRTTDRGLNWTKLSSGKSNDLLGVFFTDANNGTAVGVAAIIISTRPGGLVPVQQEPKTTLPRRFILEQNYPNPFNPMTTKRYTLPNSENVSLVIYNLLGKEVTRLVDSKMPAGHYTVTWDASKVASGIYFYRLRAGDFVQTRKMLFLK